LTRPAAASSKELNAKRTALRAALGVLALLAVVKMVSVVLERFRQAGAPSTRSNIAMLESSADNLRYLGFSGCPTVQQIMDLTTPEYARTSLLMDTNGIDPWGTPYQVECDPDKVHVFSMGPDKQAGTADDIRWKP
jgi:hypothetical protein